MALGLRFGDVPVGGCGLGVVCWSGLGRRLGVDVVGGRRISRWRMRRSELEVRRGRRTDSGGALCGAFD